MNMLDEEEEQNTMEVDDMKKTMKFEPNYSIDFEKQ